MHTIKIHNVETGEVIEREMTKEEIAQIEADKLAFEAEKKARQEMEVKKEAAAAKLASLGITVEDLKVLGLG